MQLFNQYPHVAPEELSEMYTKNAVFEDPITRIEGLDNISRYFAKLYQGVISCEFDYHDVIVSNGQAAISWIMTLRHRSFKRGNPVKVIGCSIIRYDGKVYYHRDYFDMAEMVYANIPVLGWFIRTISKRMHA